MPTLSKEGESKEIGMLAMWHSLPPKLLSDCKKQEDGSFVKCCGRGVISLSAEDRGKIVEDIRARVAKEIAKQIADQASQQLDAFVTRHVEGLRNEVAQDITTIKQSVAALQSTTDVNSINQSENIRGLEARLNAFEADITNKIENVILKVATALAENKNGNSQNLPSTSECLAEVEDRLSRLSNVIIVICSTS